MTPPLITWVCPTDDAPPPPRFHVVGHDNAFVREVARYAGVTIPRIEGTLLDAGPQPGFILWNAHGLDLDNAVAASSQEQSIELSKRVGPRLVQFNVSTSRLLFRLERASMPAAIDTSSLWSWAMPDPARPGRQGIYGRRAVAVAIDAVIDEKEQSEHFCFMWGTRAGGLPHLLADYLAAFGRIGAWPDRYRGA